MHARPFIHKQRGLSIIEFMVGIAVGMVVVAGTITLFVNYLNDNRKLLVETRVNQDLRAAADLVVRDLRRAGYWRKSVNGVWSTGATSSTPNPFGAIASTDSTTDGTLAHNYDKDGNDTLDSSEQFGFQRALNSATGKYVLQMKDGGGGWQDVTDPTTMNITAFGVTTTSRDLELYKYCDCLKSYTLGAPICTEAALLASSTRPKLTIRRYELSISGQSVTDSAVSRTITETVRARNDQLSGACPAT